MNTAVTVGEHDPALPAAVTEQTWLVFYPNAELDVLANAGLVASIEGFLGQG